MPWGEFYPTTREPGLYRIYRMPLSATGNRRERNELSARRNEPGFQL